jgi:hypothetical protein
LLKGFAGQSVNGYLLSVIGKSKTENLCFSQSPRRSQRKTEFSIAAEAPPMETCSAAYAARKQAATDAFERL